MRFKEIVEALEEGYVPIAGRTGNRIVRKYRCTSGSRRGRIVSKPGTCNAPRNIKSSVNIKKAKRRLGSLMAIKSARTKRARKTTKRLKALNVHSRSKLTPRRKSSAKRKR
jgi:hypothetical protein